MAINTTQINRLLRPGLAAIWGYQPEYRAEFTEIFSNFQSDKQFEQETELKFLGLASVRPEGGATASDDMGQRATATYFHQFIALQFAITQSAQINNLYKNDFPAQARSLKKSMDTTKEILGAAVINNGFNAAFPGPDGLPLFSTAHPIDGGTLANRPTVQADLNEASLESAIITMQSWKDTAGLQSKIMAKKLIVPTQGQFVAERLLKSQFRVNTANNDINALYSTNSVPEGYRVNHFLTAYPNGWYLLSDAANAFKHYIRLPMNTSFYTDFTTDNLLCKAVECYSFGFSDWRGAYASSGLGT